MSSRSPSSGPSAHIDLFGWIACVLLALITLGFAAFRFAPVLPVGASRNVDKAFFSAVNLTTLSGFSQSFAGVGEYPWPGQWMIALIAFISATTFLAGGGTFLARILGMELSFSRLLVWSVGLLAAFSLVGAIPELKSGTGLLNGVSVATGLGLVSSTSLPTLTQVLLIALSVPASLGLVLLLTAIRRSHASRGAELLGLCWIAWATIYLVGLILLLLGGHSPLAASLLSVDARSLGTHFVPVTSGGPTTEWTTMGLMLLGGGPAGVSGGLTILPIAILLRCAWTSLRSRSPGNGLPDPVLGIAVAWVGLFLVALGVLVLGLAQTQPQLPGDRMLFLAISALCNVGLSHDPVSLSREGLYLLAGAMLAGRILPLAMLCWMACVSDRRASSDA